MTIKSYFLLAHICESVACICAVTTILWIFFRHDSTVVHGKSQHDGTKNARYVALIAALTPISFAVGLVSEYFASGLQQQAKVFTINQPSSGIGHIVANANIPIKTLIAYYGCAIAVSLIVSVIVIAYMFVRMCGAQSGCLRDIKFTKRLNNL